MPTLASQLVQFLMDLFNNPHAVQAFLADPEQALSDAGLGNVGAADVHAAMPVVLDYAPIVVDAFSLDREYHTAGYNSWPEQKGTGGAGPTRPPADGLGHLNDHGYAVQQLQHVVNNYSYISTVDDRDVARDVATDQSVHQNIWATGDVRQFFDSHSLIASGGHAFAAGDDIDLDDSFNVTDSTATDHSADHPADSSAGQSVTAGDEPTFGTTDLTADDNNSFNTDSAVDDSSDAGDSFQAGPDSLNTDPGLGLGGSFIGNSDDSVDAGAHLPDVGTGGDPVHADDPANPVDSSVGLAVDDPFHDSPDFWAATADTAIDDADDARFTGIEDSNVVPDHDVPDHDVDVQAHVTDAADGA
ncbi:MAG TPA: IniB N-terminal domain-containing protein [Arthrobacter sp.]|jgi:hypothetical protein